MVGTLSEQEENNELVDELEEKQFKLNSLTRKLSEKEEEYKTLKQNINDLTMEQNELTKKNESLTQEYEKRQMDLTMLNDNVKEKTHLLDELRSNLSSLNKEIDERKASLSQEIEDAEVAKKKIEGLQAENESIKLSIDKHKAELEQASNLLAVREDEIKLLNEQLERKEERKKEVTEKIQECNNDLHDLERQKEEYEDLFRKYRVELSGNYQFLIGIESMLEDLKGILENLVAHKVLQENFVAINDNLMSSLRNYIQSFTAELTRREEEIQAVTDKFGKLEKEYTKFSTMQEEIENLIIQSQKISRKLKEAVENHDNEKINQED
jgi:chromosome segregation ATPase